MQYSGEFEEPSRERRQRDKLLDIIAIGICATVCGADSWDEVALFGKSREQWFRTFLELPNGIPSHDAFARVFSQLDPDEFQRRFMDWSRAVAVLVPGEAVAIDDNTPRGPRDYGQGNEAQHPLSSTGSAPVSVWASNNSLTLGQVQAEERSNETTAIPRLLEMLALEGCIVTIEAMGCQKETARGILDRGAHYVLPVKRQRRELYKNLKCLFEEAETTGFEGVPHDYAATVNRHHGRQEVRECWSITDQICLDYLGTGNKWPGLSSVLKVVGRREAETGAAVQPRYFISSLDATAEQFLAAVRAHWAIEDFLPWSMDVTFNEEQHPVRQDRGPENLATLLNASHGLLERETSLKASLQDKRLEAGRNEDYLRKVLLS